MYQRFSLYEGGLGASCSQECVRFLFCFVFCRQENRVKELNLKES